MVYAPLDKSIDAGPEWPDRRAAGSHAIGRSRRARGGLRRRPVRFLVSGVALLLLAMVGVVVVPVPFLDDCLARKVTEMIISQMACSGSTGPPPQVTLKGGRLLPQLLGRRLSRIALSMPDTTVGGVRHATFAADLHGVTRPAPDTARAEAMDASITIGYADLPVPQGGPRPGFARAPDGSLAVTVASSPEQAKNVRATLFLKLAVDGEKVTVAPARLRVFGHVLPAAKATALTGGVRSQTLPHLPDGLHYTSISPERDGLHVALDGVATTALSTLPTAVGGRTVSYVAENGLLGISTAVKVPPIVDVPLTIFTAPRLEGGTLKLVPRMVRILGSDRGPDDLIAKLVLKQVKQEDLSRPLPTLPNGVRYKSVSVDGAGVKVAVGGVTVQPFSVLPATSNGQKITYGAQGGFLTATTKGAPSGGQQAPVVLYGNPRIVGNSLDLAPRKIQMFGMLFPADDVLSQVKAPSTKFPLQALPDHLSYTGVSVLPSGLRITVSGRGVTLSKGLMSGAGCASN